MDPQRGERTRDVREHVCAGCSATVEAGRSAVLHFRSEGVRRAIVCCLRCAPRLLLEGPVGGPLGPATGVPPAFAGILR